MSLVNSADVADLALIIYEAVSVRVVQGLVSQPPCCDFCGHRPATPLQKFVGDRDSAVLVKVIMTEDVQIGVPIELSVSLARTGRHHLVMVLS